MSSKQKDIYELVNRRGYGPETQGLTPDQFAGRQAVKVLEEIMEVIHQIRLDGLPVTRLLDYLTPRDLFDDVELWRRVTIYDPIRFTTELADAAVPLFCAAQAQGFDLAAAAREKAEIDVARGQRNGS